jgi:hypothetical protein
VKGPSFSAVSNRIVAHAGESFTTKSGFLFIYLIDGNVFVPSRTPYRISRADVEKALALVPLDGPAAINTIVRESAYLWAVLHDARISEGAW